MKLSKKLRLFLSLISLLVCVCMSSVAVSADVIDLPVEEAATSADDLVTYANGKFSLGTAKSMVQSYGEQMASVAVLSKDELLYLDQMYASQTDFYGAFATAAGDDGCGSYLGYNEESVKVIETEEKDEVKVTAEVQFTEKNLNMTLNIKCYDNLGPVVTSTEFSSADDVNETFGTKMKDAGMNTIVGMGTVFIVLILISLLISCFNFIPKIQAIFTKKEETEEEDEVPQISAPSVTENITDDLELIAVITAAIAASENTTTDGFVVRSIRKR